MEGTEKQKESDYSQQNQQPEQMEQEKISKKHNAADNEEEKQIFDTKENMLEEIIDSFEDKWLKFTYDAQDSPCGIFHVNKYILDEQAEASKLIFSSKKSLNQNKQKPSLSKYDPNFLWIDSNNRKAHTYWSFLPNKVVDTFEIGSRIYNANFNSSGDSLYTTSQTGTALFELSDENKLKLKKTITCRYVSWALTDSDFTEDNRFMIHSTLSPNVQLFDIEKQEYLAQINMDNGNEDDETDYWHYTFRIYSAKISSDGQEIISGTSRSLNGSARLQVYDVEKKRLVKSINAHENDINSICYVNKSNSSLVITGSDDGLCKLWDMRALDASRPAGIFYGHLSGITYVSSRGDNRYFISNSKDQSLKLWDLRKTRTEEIQYHHFGFDYRMEKLSATEISKIKKAMKINPNEDSVATFFGHQVYVSLVRCHFSPKAQTDQRYIYTGSADGSVYIYDILTNRLAARLEVSEDKIIRDCAWHPNEQSMITTDFAGKIWKWDHFDLNEES